MKLNKSGGMKNRRTLNVVNNYHEICQKCVPEIYEKYDELTEIGHDPFRVPCHFIKKEEDLLDPALLKFLSEDEKRTALGLMNPVEWAKQNLVNEDGTVFVARDYQEAFLKCTAQFKVIRAGRGVGKSASLVAAIVKDMFCKNYHKVIVFGPQKVHVEELHNRILGYIERSPHLRSSIKHAVKSPIFEIELENGSRVRGFASGDSSKSSGLSLRGQDANLIILDEAAYINKDTIDQAVLPLIQRFPNVRLIAASTPSGNKDKFYDWSVEDPTFKEFYWPSPVMPHWEQVKDSIQNHYRDNKDAYHREILALHGVSVDGVYNGDLVKACLKDFKYENMKPQENFIYSIGVDWNKTIGTEIVIVGYDKLQHIWKVGPCINIPKQEFTQLVALERIIDLTNLWKPEFIYIDSGYGSTQNELLKKRGLTSVPLDGWQHKLNEIVHEYNFSSKLEIRDPNTGEIVKKDAKPFMVENSVRRFEEENIHISLHDTLLQRQLGSYVVKSRSVTGRPVYGSIEKKLGDHRLDAMNLALVAYKLEMSEFSPSAAQMVTLRPRQMSAEEIALVYRAENITKPQERAPNHPLKPVLVSVLGGNVPVYRHGFMTDTEAPKRYEQKTQRNSGRMSVPSRRT